LYSMCDCKTTLVGEDFDRNAHQQHCSSYGTPLRSKLSSSIGLRAGVDVCPDCLGDRKTMEHRVFLGGRLRS
jgi:hypothetical protein